MRKSKISMAILLLMLAGQVRAQECPSQAPSANAEVTEDEVIKALEFLAKAGALAVDKETHSVILRKSVIEKLREEGKLESTYSAASVFCM